jgi:hypothetical protein
VSCLPVVGDYHRRPEPGRQRLLALRALRRSVERVAPRGTAVRAVVVAVAKRDLIRELQELIAALDRRVPRVEQAGEATIAREAAALREKAVRRLRELEERTRRTRTAAAAVKS